MSAVGPADPTVLDLARRQPKGRPSLLSVVSALKSDATASSLQAPVAVASPAGDGAPPPDSPPETVASVQQQDGHDTMPVSERPAAQEGWKGSAREAEMSGGILRVPSTEETSSESDWEELLVRVMGAESPESPARHADSEKEGEVTSQDFASENEQQSEAEMPGQDTNVLQSAYDRFARHDEARQEGIAPPDNARQRESTVHDEQPASIQTLDSDAASERDSGLLSLLNSLSLASCLSAIVYLLHSLRLPLMWKYFGVDSQKVKYLQPILVTPVKRMERDALKTKAKSSKRVHFKLRRKSQVEQFQPLERDSHIVQYWLMLMTLPLLYDIFAFGLRLAVCDIYLGKVMVIYHVDVICDVMKILDIGMSLVTAVPKGTYPKQASDAKTLPAIATLYFRHELSKTTGPTLVYQFTSCIILSLPRNDQNLRNAKIFNWVWWAAMTPRFISSSRRLYNYSAESVSDPNLTRNIKLFQLCRIVVIIVASSHLIGCAYYFVARLYDFDESTWIHALEEAMPLYQFKESETVAEYLLLVFKGFCRVASLRYDPGLPGNIPELLLGVAVMFISVWITSMILGTLLTFLVRRDPMEVAHKERMEALRIYMEQKHVPQDLYETIIRYCQFQYNKNRQGDASMAGASEMFKSLSRSLRIEVANANHRDLVSRCSKIGRPLHRCSNGFLNACARTRTHAHANPSFAEPHARTHARRCSNEFLNELVVKLKTIHVMPGDIVVHKDEIPRELYFVASGAVQGLFARVRGLVCVCV